MVRNSIENFGNWTDNGYDLRIGKRNMAIVNWVVEGDENRSFKSKN